MFERLLTRFSKKWIIFFLFRYRQSGLTESTEAQSNVSRMNKRVEKAINLVFKKTNHFLNNVRYRQSSLAQTEAQPNVSRMSKTVEKTINQVFKETGELKKKCSLPTEWPCAYGVSAECKSIEYLQRPKRLQIGLKKKRRIFLKVFVTGRVVSRKRTFSKSL